MTSTPKPRKWRHRTTVLARFVLFLAVGSWLVWRHWYVRGGWRALKAAVGIARDTAAERGLSAPVAIIKRKIWLVLSRSRVEALSRDGMT